MSFKGSLDVSDNPAVIIIIVKKILSINYFGNNKVFERTMNADIAGNADRPANPQDKNEHGLNKKKLPQDPVSLYIVSFLDSTQ